MTARFALGEMVTIRDEHAFAMAEDLFARRRECGVIIEVLPDLPGLPSRGEYWYKILMQGTGKLKLVKEEARPAPSFTEKYEARCCQLDHEPESWILGLEQAGTGVVGPKYLVIGWDLSVFPEGEVTTENIKFGRWPRPRMLAGLSSGPREPTMTPAAFLEDPARSYGLHPGVMRPSDDMDDMVYFSRVIDVVPMSGGPLVTSIDLATRAGRGIAMNKAPWEVLPEWMSR